MDDKNTFTHSEYERKITLYLFLMAAISVFLSRSGFSVFIFFIPMLTISMSIRKTRNAFLYFLGTSVVILGWKLFDLRMVLGQSGNLGIVFHSLVYFVMIILGILVWVSLRDYSDNVMRKLILASLACVFVGSLLAVWYSAFASEEEISRLIDGYYRQIISAVFGESNARGLAEIVFTIITLTVVPFGIFMSSFQILVSEFIIHKRDEKWQRNFSLIKVPDKYLFAFLGLWVLTGLTAFIQTVPAFVKVILLNASLGFCLHYALTGISILFFFIRKRHPRFTAGKIYALVLVSMLLPFLNMFIFVCLVVLGASEVWLKFRKKNIVGSV